MGLKKNGDGHLLKNADGNLVDECGGGCTIGALSVPGLTVTLTFGGGGTVDLFGYTWQSGDSNLVCPLSYICSNNPSTGPVFERWSQSSSGAIRLSQSFVTSASVHIMEGAEFSFSGLSAALAMNRNRNLIGSTWSYVTSTATSTGISYKWLSAASMAFGPGIQDDLFGSITTTGGVTISWQRAAGEAAWNTCGIS